jgi:hypothetical protein
MRSRFANEIDALMSAENAPIIAAERNGSNLPDMLISGGNGQSKVRRLRIDGVNQTKVPAAHTAFDGTVTDY